MLDDLGLIRERHKLKGIKNLEGINAKMLAHMYTVLPTCQLLPSLFYWVYSWQWPYKRQVRVPIVPTRKLKWRKLSSLPRITQPVNERVRLCLSKEPPETVIKREYWGHPAPKPWILQKLWCHHLITSRKTGCPRSSGGKPGLGQGFLAPRSHPTSWAFIFSSEWWEPKYRLPKW